MGYISWSQVPNAKYVVSVFSKNDAGNLELIATKTSENNYSRFSSEQLTTSNLYYTISALNNGTGKVITTSEPQQIGDIPPPTEECSISCNGNSYAYELSIYKRSNGANYMDASGASNYYNHTQGIYVPFWQAISTNSYQQLPSDHPYKVITNPSGTSGDPIYLYEQIAFDENTPGIFFNAQGTRVYSGFLIEKKMDQYSVFAATVTTSEPNTDVYCGPSDVFAWTTFFNNYYDDSSLVQYDDYIYFTSTLPTSLTCENGTTGGYDPGSLGHVVDWAETFLPCYRTYSFDHDPNNFDPNEFETWLDPCDYSLPSGMPTIVTGVEIVGLNSPASGSVIVNVTKREVLKKGDLKPGLYKFLIYTEGGGVIPMYQHVEEQTVKKLKDRVKVEINPNRIENNTLKFKVISEVDMPIQIKVHKLNGQMIYEENATITQTEDLLRSIDVSNGNNPYNQLRVTIVLPDGSTIQETAAVL